MTDFIIAISSDLVRAGMYASLTNHKLRVVASVTTIQQLRDEVTTYPYATVILCSQLGGDGTIEHWRRMQRRFPDLQLLLWGRQIQDVLDFQCTLKRVDGYLLDHASLDEFIEACQAVNRGRVFVAQDVAEYLARNPKRAEQRSILASLSAREIQVTQMIGRGLKVVKIAEHLNISAKTVNTFRYRIFNKLDVKGDVELTHLALQSGLIHLEQSVLYD
ncbi:LuxR C-terminal-related transcriptional regulator [Pseudidiomarina taiwanensis]|uniref:Helix-turn-helix transcriptional regulator n=1 Tax=Pseudidiomarina taiwanensis TaxID=337250 RepID=A0A432ZNA1_9GAMM|nr:LuxR C-terminal-related transcriptional regulator [Pseudidiomarina taiwanensis]RUO79332.1 helix-turn-helix transcriptional regulator [Pseudidiomarina taiwanensis]